MTTETNERKTTPGCIQVPQGACADHWHCAYPDQCDHGCDSRGATGRTCPTCAAVMMPGGAVTPEYHAEYHRRLLAGVCLASRGGRFVHAAKASHRTLAAGACLCVEHDQ